MRVNLGLRIEVEADGEVEGDVEQRLCFVMIYSTVSASDDTS